jgi:hypothetical protein
MNAKERGWKPIAISMITDDRLNKLAKNPREPYDSIIMRLLDEHDAKR